MASGPIPNQEQAIVGDPAHAWHRSPLIGSAVQVVAFLLPLLGSWLVVSLLSPAFYRPNGGSGLVLWILQAVIVGVVTAGLIGKFSRRLLPVAALFTMSLDFPCQAPSRLALGFRSRSKQPVPALASDSAPDSTDDLDLAQAQECAESAIGMLATLSAHDLLNKGHSDRVQAYANLIAEEMDLSKQDRIRLSWGALVHDLGKIEIPAKVLNNDEQPSELEWKTVAKHPADAETLLAPLAAWLGPWMGAVTEHHEHWDGSGYPAGLGGIRISLAGRITAVADAYDTMTSPHSYKTVISPEEACDELVACSGTQFDADVVRAFLRVPLDRRAIAGPSGFLANLPPVGSVRTGIVSATAAVLLVAATIGTGIQGSPVDASPIDLAFADQSVGDEVPSPDDSTREAATPFTPSTVSMERVFSTPSLTTEDGPETSISAPTSPTAPTSSVTSTDTSANGTATTTASNQPSTTAPSGTSSSTTEQATTTQSTQATTVTTVTTVTTQATTTTTLLPPIAYDDSVEIEPRKRTKIYVLENDDGNGGTFDPATLTIVTPPTHASQWTVVEDFVAYRATNGYSGPDSLEYQICTYQGACDTAWVKITVNG